VGVRFTLCFFVRGKNILGENIWTWSRALQMVGFALWHIHPGFAVVGTFCSLAVALWFLITLPYVVVGRHDIEPWDWMMIVGSAAVIVVLALPDTFFA
jgi:hypothetical protein